MIRITNMITDKIKHFMQHTNTKLTMQSKKLKCGHQIAMISIF